jgi:hypothetical protein
MLVRARRSNEGPALVRELRLVFGKTLMDEHWDWQESVAANAAHLLLTGFLGGGSVLARLRLSLLRQRRSWHHCKGSNASDHEFRHWQIPSSIMNVGVVGPRMIRRSRPVPSDLSQLIALCPMAIP